jgi:hypothetical protein
MYKVTFQNVGPNEFNDSIFYEGDDENFVISEARRNCFQHFPSLASDDDVFLIEKDSPNSNTTIYGVGIGTREDWDCEGFVFIEKVEPTGNILADLKRVKSAISNDEIEMALDLLNNIIEEMDKKEV